MLHIHCFKSGRRESVHTRGPRVLGSQVQSPLDVRFLLELFFSSLRKQYKNDNIANFMCKFTGAQQKRVTRQRGTFYRFFFIIRIMKRYELKFSELIMILEMTMTIFYGELRLLTHGQLTDLSLTLCTPKPQY